MLDRYHRVVLPIVHQAFGREVLDASAVATDEGIVVLCRASGVGKSTLACGLGLRGHDVVADDSVVLDVKDDAVKALALPFALRLLPAGRTQLGLDDGIQGPVIGTHDQGSRALRAIFVLERPAGLDGAVSIDALQSAEAFRTLLTHALCFSVHDPARTREMLQNYMTVAGRVPVYRLQLRTGFQHLHRTMDELERVL